MDERPPTRLFEDPEMPPALRADLSTAKEAMHHAGDVDAALARFSEAIAATSAPAASTSYLLWGAIGLAVVGVVFGLSRVLTPAPRAPSAPRPVQTAEVAPAPAPMAAPVETAPAPAAVEATPARPRERAERREAPVTTPAPAEAAEPAPSPLALLERETMLMSEQRREAQTGSAQRSLEIARDAAREFPSGHFRVEREAWSIIALTRLGQTDQARARAERFLAAHPRSPQAEQIRRTVGLP
jgi:hypothetical protein